MDGDSRHVVLGRGRHGPGGRDLREVFGNCVSRCVCRVGRKEARAAEIISLHPLLRGFSRHFQQGGFSRVVLVQRSVG